MKEIHGLYANIKMLEQQDLFRHFLCSLSENRQQKIEGLRTQSGRLHSLGAWVLLDRLLDEHIGLHERELTIAYGAHGKPYVEGREDIHFNLSHSGDYVLAVLAPTEVGCDIQQIGVSGREGRIAERFFTSQEQEALANGMSFYRIWARKESRIKCDGTGMAQDLREFSVIADEPERHFAALGIDGYEIAVCYAGEREYPVRLDEDMFFCGRSFRKHI